MTKIFRYNNKMFGSMNETFGCCLGASKILFVFPYFVAVTKPFFTVRTVNSE